MSVAELKHQVAALSVEERLDLAAWIFHLNSKDDPEYQRELARRMDAMDAGTKITSAQLDLLIADLNTRSK